MTSRHPLPRHASRRLPGWTGLGPLLLAGCVSITMGHGGRSFVEFEGEHDVGGLVPAVVRVLEARGAEVREAVVLPAASENTSFWNARVHYRFRGSDGQDHDNQIFLECASRCLSAGPLECDDLVCGISTTGREPAFTRDEANVLLEEIARELGVTVTRRRTGLKFKED